MIRVEYTADAWVNLINWIKEYSFQYSLLPAKYWKSFGSLEISLDASALNSSFTTNIGPPNIRKKAKVLFWNFTKLPSDDFIICYTPKINSFAKFFITIGPFGLSIFIAFLIGFAHFINIRRFRILNPTKKRSWIVIFGSIVNPILILIGYMVSFVLIDFIIGSEAGGRHGYIFFVILLYPIFLPIYLIIMWLIDNMIKKRINNAL